MSMFLPNGPDQTQAAPSGVADITPANPETSSADIALMQRVLSAAARNVNLIPADFMAYVLDWIQTQRLTIPVSQVFGYQSVTQSSRAHLAVNQTLVSGGGANLNFDTVDFDYGGLFSAGNHWWVVQKAGKYIVGCGVSFDANATGNRTAEIDLNGSLLQGITKTNLGASTTTDINIVTAADLNVGDGVRVAVSQNSGGDLDVLSGTQTNFWMARIGA